MSFRYNGSVGYKGYAAIHTSDTAESTAIRLLATGGQISLAQDPLSSQGVWGAGYGNAAQIAWAYNYLRLQGNVSYDLTLPPSNSQGVWDVVKAFAFDDRTGGKWIDILPDGFNGYKGKGFCSGVSFNCSEGAIVSGDVNFQGDAGDSNGGVITGETINEYTATHGIPTDLSYVDAIAGDDKLIPYWATGIASNSTSGKFMDIISWNCSYNADIQLLKCCHLEQTPPLGADYLVLGEMSGDGSFTVFTIADDFSPSYYQGRRNLTVHIADYTNRTPGDNSPSTQGTQGKYLFKIPCALVSQGSTSIQTGTSYVQSDFNFTAFGDGRGAPVQMLTGANSNS